MSKKENFKCGEDSSKKKSKILITWFNIKSINNQCDVRKKDELKKSFMSNPSRLGQQYCWSRDLLKKKTQEGQNRCAFDCKLYNTKLCTFTLVTIHFFFPHIHLSKKNCYSVHQQFIA